MRIPRCTVAPWHACCVHGCLCMRCLDAKDTWSLAWRAHHCPTLLRNTLVHPGRGHHPDVHASLRMHTQLSSLQGIWARSNSRNGQQDVWAFSQTHSSSGPTAHPHTKHGQRANQGSTYVCRMLPLSHTEPQTGPDLVDLLKHCLQLCSASAALLPCCSFWLVMEQDVCDC